MHKCSRGVEGAPFPLRAVVAEETNMVPPTGWSLLVPTGHGTMGEVLVLDSLTKEMRTRSLMPSTSTSTSVSTHVRKYCSSAAEDEWHCWFSGE